MHPDVQERAAAVVPGDCRSQGGNEAMFDPFEYFVLRRRDGLLKTDFKTALGKFPTTYLVIARAEHWDRRPAKTLQLVPGTTLNIVERCSGHDGTWGVSPSTTKTR